MALPSLDKVISSSLSLTALDVLSLRLSAISLGRNIVTISNKNQTMVKSTPGEFPALILKPKNVKRNFQLLQVAVVMHDFFYEF